MSQRQILPTMEKIWSETISWQPSKLEQQQFENLYNLILEGNRQLNLTRITKAEDFWEKHIWDSLVPIFLLKNLKKQQNWQVIDIGSGAGFPGVPVAIALPSWTLTLLDSTQKKVYFLETLVDKLQLKNVKTLTGRAETLGQNYAHRESYDLALIRAVGKSSVCAEYTIPFLKIGGIAILYRGHWSEGETNNLANVVEVLGAEIEAIKEFNTPLTKSIRNCIYLRKISPTPIKFPRSVGVAANKPL